MEWRRNLTTIARIFVGLLFIISGLIKANDPVGFSYKLEEYFQVFGTGGLKPFALAFSMAICIFEVFVGVALLVGAYVRLTVWLLLIMIVFFTFLTFFSAYFNKVTDCGCFGDALKLTPWQSFWKDIILLIFILILTFNARFITPLFGKTTRNSVALGAMLLTTLFTLYAWYFLPPVDFRPYKVGNNICKLMEVPEGELKSDEVKMIFIYEKDGKQYEFSMDTLSKVDIGSFKYVDRKDKIIRKAYQPPIHDFSVSDRNGQDITSVFLEQKGYRLVIFQYDLEKSNTRVQEKLNKLVSDLMGDGKVRIWAFTCSSNALITNYREVHKLPYDFHSADCTMLKTVIRSNPGLVLMNGCVVEKMWPSTDLPSREELLKHTR